MVIDGLGRVDVTHLIQLRNIAFCRRMENSVLCRLFCVLLNGPSLYDDCMLAVLHDKAVKDVLIHLVLLGMSPYCIYTCMYSVSLFVLLSYLTNKRVH